MLVRSMVALVGAWLLAAATAAASEAPAALVRFPHASADRIVFSAYGNLWTVARDGGAARRLTDEPGTDFVPRYSPNGKWIAYTATRPGGDDVYVVAAAGGTPKRLTFRSAPSGPGTTHGVEDNVVSTWTPDSRSVVFLSRRMAWNDSDYRAFRVPVDGGYPAVLAPSRSGFLSFGPNGTTIAYDRALTDFLTRKRYDGGLAQKIFTYDVRTGRQRRITHGPGSDTSPMWYGGTVYFLSDRDEHRRANVWAYDTATERVREVTRFADWDVDFPSLGSGLITFAAGGRLYAIDLPSERVREVPVVLPHDDVRVAASPRFVGDAARTTDIANVVDYSLSPHADRTLIAARGNIFAVENGGGRARCIACASGADADHPVWSPDGRFIAFTTDERGETQLAVAATDDGSVRTLTAFSTGYLLAPRWSPDGTAFALPDANHDLWLVRFAGSQPVRIARDPYADVLDARFSPDGRWLAYSTVRATQLRAIHLHEIATGRDVVVSDPADDDRDPVFSPDGSDLYFVSRRRFRPIVSENDGTDVATIQSDGVYVATLDRSAPSPLGPHAPTSPVSGAAASSFRIDLDGLTARAVVLPIAAADVASLDARGDRIVYETRPPATIAGASIGDAASLDVYDLRTRTNAIACRGEDSYALSADGTAAVVVRGATWSVVSLDRGTEHAVDLGGVRTIVDPRREWREEFERVWRTARDVFFDPRMDGVDWQAVRAAYARLLPQLGSRADLAYLLGQMLGELGSSHTFVDAIESDDRRPAVAARMLGVDFAIDPRSGRYRIAKIYDGDVAEPGERGPLRAPGLDVRPGDYVLAVNGRELVAPGTPDALLEGAPNPVVLAVSGSANGPRRVVSVEALADERGVRKADWIERNRRTVDRLSGGRVGYVYLSDFYDVGSREFARQFSSQLDRAALVVDVRWNHGGFTSQFVLDALSRGPAGSFVNREGASTSLPSAVLSGPKIALIDEYTSSDGDQFAYYFRAEHLGELVGTRTWGGVRGLDGRWPLRGGGYVTIPKDVLAGPNGERIIENRGVAPDVEVDDDPNEASTGRDVQLERATNILVRALPSG